jgi:hypothetical protein
MCSQRIKNLLVHFGIIIGTFLGKTLFIALTFSYYVRLQNSTVEPIKRILSCPGDHILTRQRISKFLLVKKQELRHVRVAVRPFPC